MTGVTRSTLPTMTVMKQSLPTVVKSQSLCCLMIVQKIPFYWSISPKRFPRISFEMNTCVGIKRDCYCIHVRCVFHISSCGVLVFFEPADAKTCGNTWKSWHFLRNLCCFFLGKGGLNSINLFFCFTSVIIAICKCSPFCLVNCDSSGAGVSVRVKGVVHFRCSLGDCCWG